MLLKNGLIYQDGEFRKKDIRIMEGKILEIGTDLPEMEEEILEIQGFRVIPGFVEIHMHGAVGVDVNAADAEGFEKISRFLATQGVTGWLCSILTDTEEQTLKCIHEYRRWKELPHWGAELMGIHLEGPFLGEKYKGAMPPHLLRDINLETSEKISAGGGRRNPIYHRFAGVCRSTCGYSGNSKNGNTGGDWTF